MSAHSEAITAALINTYPQLSHPAYKYVSYTVLLFMNI